MKVLQHQKNSSSNSNSPVKNSPKKRPTTIIQSTLPIKRPKISLVDESPTKQMPSPQLPWVEKYKPTNLKQLIGQQTDKCPTNKLLDWLKKWAANHLATPVPGEKKKARPNPFAAQSDGSAFKVALLSGPPGIGKTTAAVMCCKELGLAFVEMNASDARNKLSIEKHSEQITNNQIEKYCKPKTINEEANENSFGALMPTNKQNVKKSPKKRISSTKESAKQIDHVLIMDEVDGMSGNADRAGIAELIQIIKRTKVPIICICNDRQSRKIRSLANYCFDLRFQRPRADQIKGRLLTIMSRENVQISKEVLDRIIEASNQDIRNCINTLQLMRAELAGGTSNKDLQKKDIIVNIFEAARLILNVDTPFLSRVELYFTDYSLMSLFVQENYPNVRGSRMSNLDHLRAIQQASDSIAFSDIVDRQIRSNSHWGLLNEHAIFSCALPATFMDGYMAGQIQFPAWFGKNSNAQKRQRLMRQLGLHTHLKITGSNQALVQDYLPLLRERLYRPLLKNDTAGVKDVLPIYKHYCLLKEDTEAINELGVWPAIGGKRGGVDLASLVSTKAKSALTRQLNKEKRMLPFAQPGQIKIQRKGEKTAATMKKNNKIGGKEDDGEHVDEKEEEAGTDEDMEMEDDEQNEMMIKMEY